MATLLGVAQMTAIGNRAANLKVCTDLIKKAASLGVKFFCLPECFDFVESSTKQSSEEASTLDGDMIKTYRDFAQHYNMWLSLGGFHEKSDIPAAAGKDAVSKIFNTHLVVNPGGQIVSVYRKIHMFDASVPNGPSLCESAFTQPGDLLTICPNTPVGNVGLTTCYDLRFPYIYSCLRDRGAHVLLAPAAFTSASGKDHWEVLVRARAIETQIGSHHAKRSSYGHAMIVDPWGAVRDDGGGDDVQVVAQCGDVAPNLAVAEINLDYMNSIREKMPVMAHQRLDLLSKWIANPHHSGKI